MAIYRRMYVPGGTYFFTLVTYQQVIVWQEEDVYCANVPALSGCHTWLKVIMNCVV